MAKIKINFTGYTDADLLVKGTSIVTAMTGNPHFASPIPTLAEVTAALDAFDTALQNMVNGGKETTMIKNKARGTVETLLTKLGLYVQMESNGDELILQSTGYELITRRSAIGVLNKPVNFVAKAGDVPGCIKLSLQTIDGARSYNFEYTSCPVTDGSVWTPVSSPRTNCSISSLVSGTQYGFRSYGVGADPTKVYSDVVTSYIL